MRSPLKRDHPMTSLFDFIVARAGRLPVFQDPQNLIEHACKDTITWKLHEVGPTRAFSQSNTLKSPASLACAYNDAPNSNSFAANGHAHHAAG
jgi:hypothetical protein